MKKTKKKQIRKMFIAIVIIAVIMSSSYSKVNAATESSILVFIDVVSYPFSLSAPSPDSSANGHAFLLIHNNSSIPITIGHMVVGVGEYITVGTFDNRSVHHGIWYNIEGACMTAIKLTSYARLSYALTSLTEVNNLNAAINSSDYWLLAFNCSCFARYCWNAVAPNSMQLTGSTPLLLKSSILSHGGMTSGIVDYQKPDNTIAYHTPTGYVIFPAGKNSDIFLGENE